VLGSLERDPSVFGLIHADLHPRNILYHRETAGAIDYDDCGWGWWMYDLAVTWCGFRRAGAEIETRDCLLASYREHRTDHEFLIQFFDLFVSIRDVSVLLWITDMAIRNDYFRKVWGIECTRAEKSLRAYMKKTDEQRRKYSTIVPF
jgi:Ser/Thr protein kinase RdoA (MazF antagonist)